MEPWPPKRFTGSVLSQLRILMKQRSLPFESGFRSFQRGVSWFMPEGCDPETAEAFKLRTIISVSLLVGTSGFPFMLLFFFMQHPREGLVVLWSWFFFMAIPFLVRRGWRTTTLAHLVAANYYQCHFFLLLIWGGVEAPNTMWFAAIPVVSVLVGSIAHLEWRGASPATPAARRLREGRVHLFRRRWRRSRVARQRRRAPSREAPLS